MTDQLFSNYNYFKNPQFQRLMRNWNIYLHSNEAQEEVLSEWEETLLFDFLVEATAWKDSHNITWGRGLE